MPVVFSFHVDFESRAEPKMTATDHLKSIGQIGLGAFKAFDFRIGFHRTAAGWTSHKVGSIEQKPDVIDPQGNPFDYPREGVRDRRDSSRSLVHV